MSITKEHLRKLRWQCRRGMLELDKILLPFVENHFEKLTQEEQAQFEALLTTPDQRLNAWLMGVLEPEDESMKHIVRIVRASFLDHAAG